MRIKSIVLSMAVLMTMAFASFAHADYLGMDDVGDYTWNLSFYQNVVDEAGNDIDFSYSEFADVSTLRTKLVGKYIWGVMDLEKVQNISNVSEDVWPESGTPLTVTGVFWGLKIEDIDPATLVMSFSGGEGKFYSSETTDVTTAPEAPTAGTTDITNGELDLSWFEAQYGSSLALDSELADFQWVPGADATNADITQTAVVLPQLAQGTFFLDFLNTSFADHIGDDTYSNLVDGTIYDAAARGTATIQYEDPNGWDFASNLGTTLTMHAVPEPSSFILIGLGLAGCFFYTRRQRNLL